MTNKKSNILGSILFSSLLLIITTSLASAVTCDTTLIQLGATPQTFTCYNDQTSTIQLNSSGYFSLSQNNLPANISTIITVTINANAPVSSSGYIRLTGTNTIIPVEVTNPNPQQTTSGCQINPSLAMYTQSIQQGTTLAMPKITFNPIDCTGTLVLTASSVSIQGGIITTSGQKPVYISSVVSDGVFINVDTTGLQSQTYTSYLNINAFGKVFQIPFNIIVTTGTSPASNFSVSSLPTCSLTANQLNLNQTYSMVCTNLQPDVTITPRIDATYVEGTGVDTSTNQYIWYFRPRKFGNTFIYADYYYRNSPVGTPFTQEVKISSSGLGVGGTDLNLIFTPSLELAKPNQEIIVQMIDNKTNSLVTGTLYIDARLINDSQSNFLIKLDAQKNYSFRATAYGYADLVRTYYLNSKPLDLTITPTVGDSATIFTINSSVENVSLLIDGVGVVYPYSSTLTAGEHTIQGIKEGFISKTINITVDPSLTATPTPNPLKLGVKTVWTLSKNTSWNLYYQKDYASVKEGLIGGNGTIVEYKTSKKGIYSLATPEGQTIGTWAIESSTAKWFGLEWYYVLGGAIVLIMLLYYGFSSKSNSNDGLAFGGSINAPS